MSFSWSTFALQAINFLVLVWLLRRFLLKPVQAVVAQRKEDISHVLAEAVAAREKAEAARKDFASRQGGIEEERQRVIDKARIDLESERLNMLEKARADVETIKSATLKQINEERDAAAREVFEHSVRLAVRLSETLLRDLKLPQLDDLFLPRVLDHIDGLSNDERAAMLGRDGRDGGRLAVTTAHALGSELERKWEAALHERLSGLKQISFAADEGLIAGAELQFPNAVLRFSWRNSLSAAQRELIA
jgi:F0F1-type ATP synthase membrane subunit b/b'